MRTWAVILLLASIPALAANMARAQASTCDATVKFAGKTTSEGDVVAQGGDPAKTRMTFDITLGKAVGAGGFVYTYFWQDPTGTITAIDSAPTGWTAAQAAAAKGQLRFMSEMNIDPVTVLVDSAHPVTVKAVTCTAAG